MIHDEYSPEGYAEREARDIAASLEFGDDWQALVTPIEESRYVSENDVEGGYDPVEDWEHAYGLWSERMYDPDR